MTWEAQADGSYLGAVSPVAQDWANGDEQKLVAISFAAFCRDMQLDPEWKESRWNVVGIDPFLVHVIKDTSPDVECFSTAVEAQPGQQYAVVRLLAGRTPVTHILGLSGILDQIQRNPAPHPRFRLLSCAEWLKAFPVHHTPYIGPLVVTSDEDGRILV